MRTVTKQILFFFLFTAVGLSAQPAQNSGEQIKVPFSDPSRPGTLRVRLFQGRVTIKSYSGAEVLVSAPASAARNLVRSNTTPDGLRRLTSNGFAATEENNVVSLRGNGLENISLDIQVPVRTNLQINSGVSGNIVIEGVEGDIEVTSMNDDVKLTDVGGSVVAHSMNGNVQVSMKSVTAQKPMAFTSVNGNVDVTLPPATKANLKLGTTNGDVYTDFDVQTQPAPLRETRDRGRYRVELGSAIIGTINGGGPDFELRTVNGNVYIRKGK